MFMFTSNFDSQEFMRELEREALDAAAKLDVRLDDPDELIKEANRRLT